MPFHRLIYLAAHNGETTGGHADPRYTAINVRSQFLKRGPFIDGAAGEQELVILVQHGPAIDACPQWAYQHSTFAPVDQRRAG